MKITQARLAQHRSTGFSLTELLVAMMITVVLILVMVSLTSTGLNVWKRNRELVSSTNLARVAVQTLNNDLEQLQLRSSNPSEWLVAEREKATDDLWLGPAQAGVSNAARLLFYSCANDRNNGKPAEAAGDITGVGYRLVYRDHILNTGPDDKRGYPVFALYRQVIDPQPTYDNLLGKTNLADAYKQFEDRELDTGNFLVSNIVELTIGFELQSTNSGADEQTAATTNVDILPLVASGGGVSVGCEKFSVFGDRLQAQGGDMDVTNAKLKSVIISLSVVSDEGMEYARNVALGRIKKPMSSKEFFKRFTRQFCQRIKVPEQR